MREDHAPQSYLTPPHSLVFERALEIECSCLAPIKVILNQSRKESTRTCYQAKWRCFLAWAQYISIFQIVQVVQDYLLSLKTSGLSISSLQIQLAAISTFLFLVAECSIFNPPSYSTIHERSDQDLSLST